MPELERQRTSGPQKRTKSVFYLLAQGFAGYLMQPLLLFACISKIISNMTLKQCIGLQHIRKSAS